MATTSVSTIKTEVRKHLDEIGVNDSAFVGTSDSSNLDSIIESKIEGAVNYVHENALLSKMDLREITATQACGTNITNYLRLVKVYKSGWAYSVINVVRQGDPAWAIASDSHCGATEDRPMVLMEASSGGILFTSVPSGATVVYIKTAAITSSAILIDANMKTAVYYQIAGEVLASLGDARAEAMFTMARMHAGVSGVNKGG